MSVLLQKKKKKSKIFKKADVEFFLILTNINIKVIFQSASVLHNMVVLTLPLLKHKDLSFIELQILTQHWKFQLWPPSCYCSMNLLDSMPENHAIYPFKYFLNTTNRKVKKFCTRKSTKSVRGLSHIIIWIRLTSKFTTRKFYEEIIVMSSSF